MRLTVVQTLPELNSGGVERGTLEIAAELTRRGHRSIVISSGGRLVEQLEKSGSKHIALPIGKKSLLTFRHISSLREILAKENANILHARSRFPAWISYLAWKHMPVSDRPRFITTFHGPYSVNAYSKIMVKSERVIAVSEYIRRYILEGYPDTDPGRIEVIHRGVAQDEFPWGFRPEPAWLAKWQENHPGIMDKFLITLPGRITRRKGHEDFIRIIRTLVSNHARVHGLIIGGPHKGKERFFGRLRNMTKHCGMENHITFLGHRNDMRELLSISNVVLSLSKKPEAFGRTVLEALSLGKPVIAYAIGGVTEILDKIFPEGIVKYNDSAEVVSKIREIMQKHPVIPASHPFTLEQMLDKTISLYEKMHAGVGPNHE
jgi:glycosyltransferase involved in cell wall biosynthesis